MKLSSCRGEIKITDQCLGHLTMGYSLLTESDSAVESAETSPSRRLPRYNHILIIALASIAINILLLLRILLPSPTLFPAARDTNGFSTDTPFGDCKIISSSYHVDRRLIIVLVPFDTYMVMNNDTSFTVLDQNFKSETTFDLSDENTRKSLYFESKLGKVSEYAALLTLNLATWLALEQSKIGNARSEGLSVKDTAADPSAWGPDTRVFALSAFHHVHCIVSEPYPGLPKYSDRL